MGATVSEHHVKPHMLHLMIRYDLPHLRQWYIENQSDALMATLRW